MPSSLVVDRRLPLDRLPDPHRGAAAKAIAAHDARDAMAMETRARSAEAALDAGLRELADRVGPAKLGALRAAMARERQAFRNACEPPAGLGADRAKLHAARKARVAEEARRLGIDPALLRAAGDATSGQVLAGLGMPAGTITHGGAVAQDLARWQRLSTLHTLPLDWGVRPPVAPPPDQFTVFGPDFSLWNLAFEKVESDNFQVRREYSLYEHSGAIGNIAFMDCGDAGSFDFASAQVDTELVFIYEAPRTGRLEVIIDAMNAFGHHDLRIADEWGWSDHWTHQYNYLSLNVFHPAVTERSLALMDQFDADGNEDRTWSVRALTPGNHYYAHLLSNGVVQAGDTFFVGVGSRTFDKTRANDVEVHSKSNFQWWIRSAEVRVVP